MRVRAGSTFTMSGMVPADREQCGFDFVAGAGVAFCAALTLQILAAEAGSAGRTTAFLLIAATLLLVLTAIIQWCAMMFDRHDATSAAGRLSASAVVTFVLCLGVVITWGTRWLHPTENLTGGNDEGIYAITAANLARTGAYHPIARLLPELPPELRPWVTKKEPAMANRTATPPPTYPWYHACLFIRDQRTGELDSQFPVGYPALLGAAQVVMGFDGQRALNGILLLVSALVGGIRSMGS